MHAGSVTVNAALNNPRGVRRLVRCIHEGLGFGIPRIEVYPSGTKFLETANNSRS